MAPPVSPARRTELAPVSLRMLPAHTTTAPVRQPVRILRTQPVHTTLTPAPIDLKGVGPIPGGPLLSVTRSAPPVSVAAGHAVYLNISAGPRALQGSVTFAGQQTVRAVFLTGFGEALTDQYFTGNQKVALPPRARRLLVVGEGSLTGAPASLGSVGVEPDSSLFAISRSEFAGYGCVVQTRTAILKPFRAGDTLAGSDVLKGSTSFGVLFPAPPKASALLITVAPAVDKPAAAPTQIRWRALNATLAGLSTAASSERAAFVMTVQADGAWRLDIDLGTDWRLASVVLCDITVSDVLSGLAGTDWSFVDDRFVEPAAPTTTTVTLEITSA